MKGSFGIIRRIGLASMASLAAALISCSKDIKSTEALPAQIFTSVDANAGAWKMIDHQVSTTGVVIASYEPAGAVPIGSFQLAEPTEAERRRQERMKREG